MVRMVIEEIEEMSLMEKKVLDHLMPRSLLSVEVVKDQETVGDLEKVEENIVLETAITVNSRSEKAAGCNCVSEEEVGGSMCLKVEENIVLERAVDGNSKSDKAEKNYCIFEKVADGTGQPCLYQDCRWVFRDEICLWGR